MGESGVSQTQTALSPLEYLEELCAYALSIGMPSKEYWYDDPLLINNYIRAEEIKQRKRNTEMWLQGYYVYQAVGGLIHLANSFSKEHKAKPYLNKPIPITEEEKAEEQRRKEEKFIKFMDSLAEVGK